MKIRRKGWSWFVVCGVPLVAVLAAGWSVSLVIDGLCWLERKLQQWFESMWDV